MCPFHGWRFDAEGQNTSIPYSERTEQEGLLRTYPMVERNGLVMAWYHPDGAEPLWEIPEIPEFNDPEDFTEMETRDYAIEAPWQEMAENGVDAAHFRYVHDTEEVPELESYEADGPSHRRCARCRSSRRPGASSTAASTPTPTGPGFSVIRFSRHRRHHPDGLHHADRRRTSADMRFSFTVRKLGDDALNSSVGEAFVNEIDKQILEDTPIWEHKAYLARPALADTDGPFIKFRKWASQFYAEGVDDSELVYYPQDAFPFEPIETASRKFGSDPFDD